MTAYTVHAFVSSTWIDLQNERAPVERVFQKLRETKSVAMECFGSRNESTHKASLEEVDRSDVFIGIIGGRYGSGITEAEYRRALENNLPCFIYFKEGSHISNEDRDTNPEIAARLAKLKQELRKRHTTTKFFEFR